MRMSIWWIFSKTKKKCVHVHLFIYFFLQQQQDRTLLPFILPLRAIKNALHVPMGEKKKKKGYLNEHGRE